MLYQTLDPVAFSVGPFSIRWYGLIFAFGIFISFFILRHLARKRKLNLSDRDFDELLVISVPSIIIGARLGSVISEFSHYASSPLEIFAIWNGGLAFHGGLAGLVLSGIIFSRRKKISFYSLADLAVIPIALALSLGRIANFINGEFYGTPTSLPWGVKFAGVDGFRHPVQLYESFKNFLIFAALWLLRNKSLPPGFLFWLFIILYSGFRFITEFYKDLPALMLGFTWGQLWSIPLFILGVFMLFRLRKS